MHDTWRCCHADRLAREGGFLGIALDEVNPGPWSFSQGARQHDTWKPATAAQIDPPHRRGSEIDKLQRVGDVPDPEMGKGRRSNEIGLGLPLAE